MIVFKKGQRACVRTSVVPTGLGPVALPSTPPAALPPQSAQTRRGLGTPAPCWAKLFRPCGAGFSLGKFHSQSERFILAHTLESPNICSSLDARLSPHYRVPCLPRCPILSPAFGEGAGHRSRFTYPLGPYWTCHRHRLVAARPGDWFCRRAFSPCPTGLTSSCPKAPRTAPAPAPPSR